MKVNVCGKIYEMSRKEFEGLLKISGELVPRGIYAVEKPGTGYAELRNDRCSSKSELKRRRERLKAAGLKVWSNG